MDLTKTSENIQDEIKRTLYKDYTRESNEVPKFLSIICLSYMSWAHGLCFTNLAYSKRYIFVLRSTYIIYII